MAVTADVVLREVAENMAKITQCLAQMQSRADVPIVGDRGGRRVLEMRNINNTKFSGKADDWTDWAFVFRRSIKASSLGAYSMMVKMEEADPRNGAIDDLGDLTAEEERYSAELYDVLCQLCEGEAMAIMKNVVDCSGARAWQRLWRKFNPQTMARRIAMLTTVTSPTKITEVKDVEQAINAWEGEVHEIAK